MSVYKCILCMNVFVYIMYIWKMQLRPYCGLVCRDKYGSVCAMKGVLMLTEGAMRVKALPNNVGRYRRRKWQK